MKKPGFYLLLEIALCLLFSLLPHFLMLWPQDIMTALAILAWHVLYPVMALLLPLWAARHGAAAFLCALPPFLLYWIPYALLGLTLSALPTILTLLFSVLGANIGAELYKRNHKD